ncbi:MAG: bifunctional adenosylcobinamide kinase/adenosylcobinamide-phosphate guanylyltransferase [Janthinobacterium lividum]
MLTFVLGGARSGKSRLAESLVTRLAPPWTYVATAQAFDEEMRARIASHVGARAAGWRTVEAPLDLAGALDGARGPVLVDCLTLWVSNLLLRGDDVGAAGDGLLAALGRRSGETVVVSNEVGLGIVPDNALARAFRDAAGVLHQRVAERADRVVLVVAGVAVPVKGAG